MIVGYVPTNREQLDWKVIIKSKEDYLTVVDSGLYWVYFDRVDKEIQEFLRELEEKEDEPN